MSRRPHVFVALLMLLAAALQLAGCATALPREPVPQQLVSRAEVHDMAGVRLWGDETPPHIDKTLDGVMTRMKRSRPHLFAPGTTAKLNALALSGGGYDGAFGAGLLSGWSASGSRPQFDLVSGVSTGALIAPFVFLGPRYDGKLREIYTQYSTADLITEEPIKGLLGGTALADATPLENLIAHYVDARMLREVAAESRKGRVLLVETTNLDAQRPVIWNLGAIAERGGEEGLDLFRKVLRASTAIPGAFPPVHIKVRAGGRVYEEMHVDGGPTGQVFLLPSRIMFQRLDRYFPQAPEKHMYIIMNGRLTPEWKPIEASLLPISERSLQTVLKSQSLGDLTMLYFISHRDHMEFNLASIGDEFQHERKEYFDREYMSALFDYAYALGRSGYRWSHQPPGLAP